MIKINPIYKGTITKIKSTPCFFIVTELQKYMEPKNSKAWPITYALSKTGDYIGNTKFAYNLVNKFGISIFELCEPSHKVCSIGYNLHEKKWYGWSHRAISGFKRKRDAQRFAKSVS